MGRLPHAPTQAGDDRRRADLNLTKLALIVRLQLPAERLRNRNPSDVQFDPASSPAKTTTYWSRPDPSQTCSLSIPLG